MLTSKFVNRYTDQETFRNELDRTVKLNIHIKQLDAEAEQFVVNIQNAAWNCRPTIQTRRLQGYNYPKKIRDLVKEKRKARKTWQRTRAPVDNNIVNKLTQQLKHILIEVKNERINN